MDIILASASPRRRELLSTLTEKFKILVADTDETLPLGTHPRDGVALLAEGKGRAVREELISHGENADDHIIISADTLVEIDGIALGKPEDREDAVRMLESLSGRWHNVHTGIAVHHGGACRSKVASTAVHFRDLTRNEIEAYIDTGEPMDKAGSYGIQGLGGKFVDKIDGDFDTVVGLSVKTTEELVLSVSGYRLSEKEDGI